MDCRDFGKSFIEVHENQPGLLRIPFRYTKWPFWRLSSGSMPPIKSVTEKFENIYDISYNGKENYTLQHFKERINIYNGEDFNYEIHNVELFNGSKKDIKSD